MRNILILGAGKSSGALIDHLVDRSVEEQWQVTVADISAAQAMQKTRQRANTCAIAFDFQDESGRRRLIADADIVISMLPATMHVIIAEDCLKLKRNLVTPSYISDAMLGMDEDVKKEGLIFMNEIGLDPGIDHMSALQAIARLKDEGKEITGFLSHTGGLVAPENDDNGWHYKVTWNPRNVVLAGQGEGKILYMKDGEKVELHYEDLFKHTLNIKLEGYGEFESYPNRDSMKYVDAYGLKGVKTIYRGTLRRPPFCKGWNVLVQMGFTNRKEVETDTFRGQVERLVKDKKVVPDEETEGLLRELGVVPMLLSHKEPRLVPADFLQQVLERSWSLQPGDKDMIVMIHQIEFSDKSGKEKQTMESSLVVKGKDSDHTAMSLTVGLPMAMVTEMILNNEIKRTGVLMPRYPEIYNPILARLEKHGINFKEKII